MIGRDKDNERGGGCNENFLPDSQIVPLIVEQPPASEIDADQEEEDSLGHAPVFRRPEEIDRQTVTQARDGHIDDGAVCLSLGKGAPAGSAPEIEHRN